MGRRRKRARGEVVASRLQSEREDGDEEEEEVEEEESQGPIREELNRCEP